MSYTLSWLKNLKQKKDRSDFDRSSNPQWANVIANTHREQASSDARQLSKNITILSFPHQTETCTYVICQHIGLNLIKKTKFKINNSCAKLKTARPMQIVRIIIPFGRTVTSKKEQT